MIRISSTSHTRRHIQVIALLTMILLSGCATHTYVIPPDSYVVSKRNYTYAVYNSEHRLITHPLEDLRLEIQNRKAMCEDPISDIYIVSHGWNYTPAEAIANYHNYIELVDDFMKKTTLEQGANSGNSGCPPRNQERDPAIRSTRFQPYFIFVIWASTAKATSDLASAVLPFQLDTAIKPVTFVIDNGPFFLMTAWKQSLNAAANGLGSKYPNDYLFKNWCKEEYGTDSLYLEDKQTGRGLPMSALIYELIKRRRPRPDTTLSTQGASSESPPNPNQCDEFSLEEVGIHLVGHSYGAKLVALAGMEALRRWVLVDQRRLEKVPGTPDHTAWTSLISPTAEQVNFFKTLQKYEMELTETLDTAGQSNFDFPITSLVIINPAMHPGEFLYPTGLHPGLILPVLTFAQPSILRLIPRKAIVYSKYDYPNGTLFNMREMLLNTQWAQISHSVLSDNLSHLSERVPAPIIAPFSAVDGALSLATNAITGGVLYIGTTLLNLPFDLWHHIQANDSHGLGSPAESPPAKRVALQALNGFDFFIPVYPPGFSRDEDEQGILRLSRPALGKTGLKKIAEGRESARIPFLVNLNLWGLETFYADGKAPDYGAQTFCEFAGSLNHEKSSDTTPEDSNDVMRLWIYSFDASAVYNEKLPPKGAHDNVRSRDLVRCNEASAGLQKRAYTFNFVYNFTKTAFSKRLEQLSAKTGSESR